MLNHQPLQMPFAPLNGPAEERRRFVYRSSPRTDSSRLERPEADPLAGWRQAVFGTGSSCQWGQLKWQQFVFLFCFSFSPFYSYKLYFLYVDVMEALMVRSILLNNLLFCFLIMSKCLNLSFPNLCLRGIRHRLTGPDRTSTEEWAQPCLVLLRLQEAILLSGHHNASNLSWKPATILLFCSAHRICTLWGAGLFFYAIGRSLMFVKLVWGLSCLNVIILTN